MKLADYIKQLRIEKEYSQRKLAELCGISNTEISRIENGSRIEPSPIVLIKIAKCLNINYMDLYLKAGFVDKETVHKWIYEK